MCRRKTRLKGSNAPSARGWPLSVAPTGWAVGGTPGSKRRADEAKKPDRDTDDGAGEHQPGPRAELSVEPPAEKCRQKNRGDELPGGREQIAALLKLFLKPTRRSRQGVRRIPLTIRRPLLCRPRTALAATVCVRALCQIDSFFVRRAPSPKKRRRLAPASGGCNRAKCILREASRQVETSPRRPLFHGEAPLLDGWNRRSRRAFSGPFIVPPTLPKRPPLTPPHAVARVPCPRASPPSAFSRTSPGTW